MALLWSVTHLKIIALSVALVAEITHISLAVVHIRMNVLSHVLFQVAFLSKELISEMAVVWLAFVKLIYSSELVPLSSSHVIKALQLTTHLRTEVSRRVYCCVW